MSDMRAAAAAVGVILLTAAHASAQATKQLYAVAVDRAHSPVTDLQASDFAITEDGVARQISQKGQVH
jgi:hypothetical protein